MRRFFSILSFTAWFFYLASAQAGTISVFTTADDNTVNGNCTLREAIIATNTNVSTDLCSVSGGPDVIQLFPGTYQLTLTGAGEDAAAFGDLDITGTLTIVGANPNTVIIDGNGTDRVFHILTGLTVTIRNLQIIDGQTGPDMSLDRGGAIRSINSALTLENVQVLGNHTGDADGSTVGGAAPSGGGISVEGGGSLTVRDCLFDQNTAGDGFNDGVPTSPKGGSGGAINAAGGSITIERSTFSQNASGRGADVPSQTQGGNGGDGGAIACSSCGLTMSRTTVSGNHAGKGGLGSSLSASSGRGGGVGLISATSANIENSTISGNVTDFNSGFGGRNGGGGIYSEGSSSVVLSNLTIANNEAGFGAGLRTFTSTVGVFGTQMKNTLISGNLAGQTQGFFFSDDCFASDAVSQGNNLIRVNTNGTFCGGFFNGVNGDQVGDQFTPVEPNIGPLQDNGGTSFTHALLANSPAIDAGGTCPATDQRGLPSPLDGDGDSAAVCDIGAYEFTPSCGDSGVDPGEQCDDGDLVDGNGCSSACFVEYGWSCTGEPSVCTLDFLCGDGNLDPAEYCDDNGTSNGDGCSATCFVEPGYSCDNGAPSTCTLTCSNSQLDPGEECDDAGTATGDGCSSACTVEEGYVCDNASLPSTCVPACGNNEMDPDEECDDAGIAAGDGCSSACTVEEGYVCDNSSLPSACVPACGNNEMDPDEECDDGNNVNDDGCSTICRIEAIEAVAGVCGDGQRDSGEACDDGNIDDRDGCSPACELEFGFTCDDASPSSCSELCGNGLLDPGEFCDDGNPADGDGCGSQCFPEPGFACSGEPSACAATCGDGGEDPGEECDDGNLESGDGCSSTCFEESSSDPTTTPTVDNSGGCSLSGNAQARGSFWPLGIALGMLIGLRRKKSHKLPS